MWCLVEAGCDFELVLASSIYGPDGHIWKGGKAFGIVDTPEYLAMNPNGTVPTIMDTGLAFWESNSIITYISSSYAPALKGDNIEFARALAWMGWCNTDFGGPLGIATKQLMRMAPHFRDPELLRGAEKGMQSLMAKLNRQLEEGPYLLGANLSLADISLAPFVQRWMYFPLEGQSNSPVVAWLERLSKRKGFKEYVLPREYHIDEEFNV